VNRSEGRPPQRNERKEKPFSKNGEFPGEKIENPHRGKEGSKVGAPTRLSGEQFRKGEVRDIVRAALKEKRSQSATHSV